MNLTHSVLTTEVELDEESVSTVVNTLRGLSWSALIKFVLLAVVLFIVIQLLIRLSRRMIEHSRIEKSLHGFIRTGVKITMYFIGIVILCGSLNIDVTSLIALFSVIGLALSLAVQGSLSNLAGGIVILVTKPFHVGDYCCIGGQEGTVEEIGMTYTTFITLDHRKVYIPNANVTSSEVVNYTTAGRRRVEVIVTASYDCDVEQVKAALQKAIDKVPEFADAEEKFARVSGYKDGGIEYTVRSWCKSDIRIYWSAYFNLMEAINAAYHETGVFMAYTSYNIYVKQNAKPE